MTIQVINDVVTLQHYSPSDQWTTNDEGEESYLRLRKKSYDEDSEDDYSATNTSISTKDSDDESVLSTSSSTITSSNRVSFADELVTMEWTRPYTEIEDIPRLYYSTEETNRFRHQYRLERKLLNNSDDDDALMTFDDESSECSSNSLLLCQILDSSSTDFQQPKTSSNSSSSTTMKNSVSRRSISRVVVLHNDKVASFADSSNSDTVPADFFDTPEFWSGSITWW